MDIISLKKALEAVRKAEKVKNDQDNHESSEFPHRIYDKNRDIEIPYGFEMDERGFVYLVMEKPPKYTSIDNIAYEDLTLRDIFEGKEIQLDDSNTEFIKDVTYVDGWKKGYTVTDDAVYFELPCDLKEGREYVVVYKFSSDRTRVGSSAHPSADLFGTIQDTGGDGTFFGVQTMSSDKNKLRVNFSDASEERREGDMVSVKGVFAINTDIFSTIPSNEEMEDMHKWYLKLLEELI